MARAGSRIAIEFERRAATLYEALPRPSSRESRARTRETRRCPLIVVDSETTPVQSTDCELHATTMRIVGRREEIVTLSVLTWAIPVPRA